MSKVEVNQISSQCGSTLTIGQSGDTVTLACGATQTGFGRTGTVDWDTTAKTASFTVVSGNGYFVNTTSTAITVTLPAGSAGSIVSLKDYANTWQTNNVTVTPNGTDKINGINENAVLNTQDQSVTLVYVDSTKGWRAVQDSTSDVTGANYIVATGGTITTCGNYKIHTFTSPGTFCVSSLSNNPTNNNVDYLVVAGGASGGRGSSAGGGGGGAGGARMSSGTATGCYTSSPLGACVSAIPVSATGFPITVGAGGAAQTTAGAAGNSGSQTIFSTITSSGGGGGAGHCGVAGSGGSGGGGAPINAPARPGGSGNTPPVSPPQGNNGGAGHNGAGGTYPSGGGGGAGAVGTCRFSPPDGLPGGPGGVGIQNNIDGNNYYWAGGGGGSSWCNSTGGNGGTGGGGGGAVGPSGGTGGTGGGTAINSGANGGTPFFGSGGNAGANTGGGGGGGNVAPGSAAPGSGGSGIVVIRYKYQ
jgi:hypothetical protein